MPPAVPPDAAAEELKPASLHSARDSLTSMLTTSSSSGPSVYLASPTSPTFTRPVVRVEGEDIEDAEDAMDDVRTPRVGAGDVADFDKTPVAGSQCRGARLRNDDSGRLAPACMQPWMLGSRDDAGKQAARTFTTTTAGLFMDEEDAVAPVALDESPTLRPTTTTRDVLPFLSLRSRDCRLEQLPKGALTSEGPAFVSYPEQLDEVQPWTVEVSLPPAPDYLAVRSVSLSSLSSISSSGSSSTSPGRPASCHSKRTPNTMPGSHLFRSFTPLMTSSTPDLCARPGPPAIPGPLTRSTSSTSAPTTAASNSAVLGRRAIRAHYRRSTASSNMSILDTVPELPRDMDLAPDGSWALRPRFTPLHRSTSQPALRGQLRATVSGTEGGKACLKRVGSFYSTDRKETQGLTAASSAKRNIQQLLSQRARKRAIAQAKPLPSIWTVASGDSSPNTSRLIAEALGLPPLEKSFVPTRRAPKPPGAAGDGKEALKALREAENWHWPTIPTLGTFAGIPPGRLAASEASSTSAASRIKTAQEDDAPSFVPEMRGSDKSKTTGTFGKWRRALRGTHV